MNRRNLLLIGLAACLTLASVGCAQLKNILRNPPSIQTLARDTAILGGDAALINNPGAKQKIQDFYNHLTDYIAKGNVTVSGLNAIANDSGIKFLQSATAQFAEQDVLATATGIQKGLAVVLGL